MPYEALIHREARKILQELPWEIYERINHGLQRLARQPMSPQTAKWKGREDLWRLRVRRYRMIYHIDEPGQVLTVLRITLRTERTYRGLS